MNIEKTAQQMVSDLLEDGMKQKLIAKRAETDPPQISRIAAGQEPRYGLGKRIEALHADHFNDKAA